MAELIAHCVAILPRASTIKTKVSRELNGEWGRRWIMKYRGVVYTAINDPIQWNNVYCQLLLLNGPLFAHFLSQVSGQREVQKKKKNERAERSHRGVNVIFRFHLCVWHLKWRSRCTRIKFNNNEKKKWRGGEMIQMFNAENLKSLCLVQNGRPLLLGSTNNV